MTLLDDFFPTGPLVLDASAIFNILGCEKSIEVVRALRVACVIEERTLAEIKRHPIPGFCHEEALFTLTEQAGVQIYRMSSAEYDLYLSLVAGPSSDCLDDGESAAIATAVSKNFAVILDDGKARRVHRGRFPGVPFASSLRLFLAAGSRADWDEDETRDLIAAARMNARMNVVKGEEPLFASVGISAPNKSRLNR
ncbi:MAG: hypothetical protein JWR22_3124 [Herminiimonas sp.]|nr:hypothetical protein [Herminiimonas sp.]